MIEKSHRNINSPKESLKETIPSLLPSQVQSAPADDLIPVASGSEGDISVKILSPGVAYVRDTFGPEKLAELATQAGLDMELLGDQHHWIPLEQVQNFLTAVRDLVGSDDAFKDAMVYRLKESYGPLRFLLRAMSPQSVYELAAKHFPAVSKISKGETERLGRTHFLLRYWCTKRESRLMCLSRQAQTVALPALWGLPHAHLNEKKCTTWGDDLCEYELRVYQPRSWVPPALGGLLGGIAAALLFVANVVSLPLELFLFAIPLMGVLSGYVIALRAMNRQNFEVSEEINEELRKLVRESVEDKYEIVASHNRRREWSRLMEEQVADRTAALESVVTNVQRMQAERSSAIRGYSHDLKNPFYTVCMSTELLQNMPEQLSKEAREIIEDQAIAVDRMREMLNELVRVAATNAGLIRLSAERLEVEPLVEVLRRRVRAFVHGRDIRVSVFATREAPPVIETDRLLFDRVVDNLLTNAAKYTARGSIVVELDGRPDLLTIKVSDTGRGIEEDNIRRIFLPGGSDPNERRLWSHGVGLSVVVRLLAQIGGRLEVMSVPDSGTTFWAHFPTNLKHAESNDAAPKGAISRITPEDLVVQVVKFRKAQPS